MYEGVSDTRASCLRAGVDEVKEENARSRGWQVA